ncbi:MAG TPA: aspartyl protease [Cyanobacteria bacterium UBA8553]|nr:aspartyl protease [Cyanobacteria bacterium UBA8553]HAJ58220.1 aspartyl protease [Cyanobacteria bacterium UBA8543]
MIEGEFDSEGKLNFEIGLVTVDSEIILADAILDTGFTEWLAINNQDLEILGWPRVIDGEKLMQTAQGETRFQVYAGTVELDEQQFNIPVLGGDTISEVLLGLPWLRTRRLIVDFLAGVLTLG